MRAVALAVGIAAGGGIGGVVSPAAAAFTNWHFESYSTTVDGSDFAVIDVYAQFDDANDTVLNVFNSMISTSTGVEFNHNDFNTLGGLAGAWNVVQSGNIPGVVDASIDSFVLIGGAIGGTNSTALDPSFDPSTGGTVAENAGWFNSNPQKLQGRVDPDSLRTWVARFVIEAPIFPVSLSFAANLGYNLGPGTPFQFAYDGGEGSGPSIKVVFGVDYDPACLSDIDGNGLVNAGDLGKILGEWGDPCCGSDIDGDGDVNAADIAALLADWGTTCEPFVESITPDAVLPDGGAKVTIAGRHLAAATSVSIGGSDAAILSASVDGVVVTAPVGTPGPAEVVVTTPFGEQILSDAFEYVSPLPWATILETSPDPKVITDPEWRERIIATGLPWRVRDNASQIEMLLVPPGTFMMGCSASNQYGCFSSENPVHEVTLTQAFYLGRYEVTQAQWTAVMGSNPSYFQSPSSQVPAEQVPNRPVERVSWNMIQGFEAETGLRLPTEAEWEYACRAGTQTAFNLPPDGTNDDSLLGQLAWYDENSSAQTRPVGQKHANNLGLCDMHGNVYEFCEDWYGEGYYEESPPVDPTGPESGIWKVVRGGSWQNLSQKCRTSFRPYGASPDGSDSYGRLIGFRASRNP